MRHNGIIPMGLGPIRSGTDVLYVQIPRERYNNYLGLLGCAFSDDCSHYHYVAMSALCMEAEKMVRSELIQ